MELRDDDGILAGQRVLVVEDEVLIAFDLRDCFQEAGARSVRLAHTVSEALPLARRAQLTSAVLDIRLGTDGVAPVAEALAARGIPFLFYTGQEKEDPVRLAFPGALALTKPTDAWVLARALSGLRADKRATA